jgi:Prephenate dehydrogenase
MYIGLHPMAGKEKGGYLNSDYLLFENSVCIVSTDSKNSQINSFLKTLKSTGMKFTFLDPALHDKIVAQVSHLPQLLSIAMVNTSTKSQNGFRYLDFAAGGFRDMTRIASSVFYLERYFKE